MDKIDPFEDTKAFVEMAKLNTIEPDLKQVAVFFPDALLIEDKDYKDPEFGRGLFALMHTDPYRFSRIVECHVNNYNVLGYRLIKESPVPEGKLVGMFILSIAIKNAGNELFEEIPSPNYFGKIIDKLKEVEVNNIEEELKKFPIPKGIKADFEELVSPLFYWNEYKKTVKEMKQEYFLAFLAHLNSVISAFLLLSLRSEKKRNVIKLQGVVGDVTLNRTK